MPYIGDREVSEDEYQAALNEVAATLKAKDDRIIYLAVRWRGDEGLFVEGGFNTEFDWMDKPRKEFVVNMAFEALIANAVAMFPGDEEWANTLTDTTLGAAGGPKWRHQPPTPHTEGVPHGDDHQAASGDHPGGPDHPDPSDSAERGSGQATEGA